MTEAINISKWTVMLQVHNIKNHFMYTYCIWCLVDLYILLVLFEMCVKLYITSQMCMIVKIAYNLIVLNTVDLVLYMYIIIYIDSCRVAKVTVHVACWDWQTDEMAPRVWVLVYWHAGAPAINDWHRKHKASTW